jgi:hypothetical protein
MPLRRHALANEARRLEGVLAFAPDQDPRHRHRPRRPCRLTPRALSAPSRLRLLGRRAWWLPPRSRGCVGASGCTNRSTPRVRRDSRVRGPRSETSVIRGKERRMGTKSRSPSDYTRMWSPSGAIEYARLASLRARVTRSPRSGGRWSSSSRRRTSPTSSSPAGRWCDNVADDCRNRARRPRARASPPSTCTTTPGRRPRQSRSLRLHRRRPPARDRPACEPDGEQSLSSASSYGAGSSTGASCLIITSPSCGGSPVAAAIRGWRARSTATWTTWLPPERSTLA